ncbi:MAG: JAB domain-containing protein [Bacteroidia bacterium]
MSRRKQMVIEQINGRKAVMNGSEQVYKFVWAHIAAMQPFDQEKENLFVIGLTSAHRVKYIDHVSMGTMHGTMAGPREIFRNAIHLGASSIVLCHNHTSHSVLPSKQDIEMTRCITQAGKLLKIEVVDHLIVSGEGYYSFADEGELG